MSPSLPQIAAFVRQHSHDLRNDLTGIELEAVLLTSIFPEGEAAEIVRRLRAQIRKVAADLQALAAHFAEPKPARTLIAARELFRMWEKQSEPAGPNISWTESLGDTRVNVDAASLAGVFRELLTNAVKFGDGSPLAISAAADAGQAIFSLQEPKAKPVDPAAWGQIPFISTKRSSYGLGLWEADRIVQANGGSVARACQNGQLITTLSFPVE